LLKIYALTATKRDCKFIRKRLSVLYAHELRLRTSCTVQKLTVPKSDCKEQEVYLKISRKEQVNSKS
jgi:hypothetical protein